MDRYQYLLLMGACAFGTLPLEFLFRARVYRRPRRLVGALALPLAVFLVWDIVAIARDHWRFNERYVTGWELPFSVPVEELTFFVVIPICALLSFEACGHVLGRTGARAGRTRIGAETGSRPVSRRVDARDGAGATDRDR